LGAEAPDRAEKSVWLAALYNMVFLGILSVVFFIGAGPILGMFTSEQTVLDIGVSALKIICLGYVFFAYGMVISQAFNGAGDTRPPLIVSFFVFWVVQIPLAYWLSVYLDWQATGVFTTIAFCHSLHAVINVILFRQGKWKLVKI